MWLVNIMQLVDLIPLRKANYKDHKGPALITFDVPVYLPPCECVDCQEQYYTSNQQNIDRYCYVGELSDPEAQQILAEYMESLRSDQEYLQRQCASHGDTIMNRWKKKSREKRQTWLLQADPTLYQH